MTRILVTGGRDLEDEPWVYTELANHICPWDHVIVGDATGADQIAAGFARGLGCTVSVHRADWPNRGLSAGPIRNAAMIAEHPDFVLAFPGGRGTADCIKKAERAGIPVKRVERPSG